MADPAAGVAWKGQGHPLPKAAVDDFTKSLGQKVVQCVKASNALPSSKEFGYYKSFPNFKKRVSGFRNKDKPSKGVGGRVVDLLERLVQQHNRQGLKCEPKGVADPEDVFDSVLDFSDARLEAVDIHLDVHTGKAPTQTAAQSPAGGKRVHSQPEDLNLDKPQLKFKEKPDNSNTPFEPKALPKVHHSPASAKGVQLSHPYGPEITGVAHQASQLRPADEIQEPNTLDETPFTWVDQPEQLSQIVDMLNDVTEIAVDLEHHSHRSFQGFTCLMQISTRQQDLIIDTIALRDELHQLLPVFTNPKIVKVFHGADMDIRWLERDFGLYVVNLFDTGQAARVLEMSSFGFAHLLKELCDEDTDKQYQLADWRLRPLTSEMMKYARIDTHFLLYIYDKLRASLWDKAGGNANLIKTVLSKSQEVSMLRYEKHVFSETQYLDMIKRSGRTMNPKQTAVFKALFQWRDTVAREADESPQFVLPSNLLFRISSAVPKSKTSLLSLGKSEVPALLREHADEVQKLVEQAAESGKSNSQTSDSRSNPPANSKAGSAPAVAVEYSAADVMDWETYRKQAKTPKSEVRLAPENRTGGSTKSSSHSLLSKRVVVPSVDISGKKISSAAETHHLVAQIRASITSLPTAPRVKPEDRTGEPEPGIPAQAKTEEVHDGEEDDGRLKLDAVNPKSIKELQWKQKLLKKRQRMEAEASAGDGDKRGKTEEVVYEGADTPAGSGSSTVAAAERSKEDIDDFVSSIEKKTKAPAEEFKPYSYTEDVQDSDKKKKKKEKIDNPVPQFNPYEELDSKSKTPRSNRNKNAGGKGQIFGSKSPGKSVGHKFGGSGGGGSGKWPKK